MNEEVMKQKVIRIIKNRININRRKRNRYWLEVEEAQKKSRLSKKDISQIAYSYNKSNQHLAICDELEEILRNIKRVDCGRSYTELEDYKKKIKKAIEIYLPNHATLLCSDGKCPICRFRKELGL